MTDKVPEMVERVARTVYTKLVAYTYTIVAFGPDAFDNESEFCKEQMRDWARACIEALRKPTEAMIRAGDKKSLSEGAHDCEVRVSDIYQAMIDEALKS